MCGAWGNGAHLINGGMGLNGVNGIGVYFLSITVFYSIYFIEFPGLKSAGFWADVSFDLEKNDRSISQSVI